MATIIRRRKLGMSSCKGISQFSKTGIKWVRNDSPLPDDNLYIRWGCTSNVPTNNVLNTAAAIREMADKRTSRLMFSEKGLAPKTWLSYRDVAAQDDAYPLIVRRATHHQGRFIHRCNNAKELLEACQQYGEGNYYISSFVDKVEEYRVAVVQGRAVWVAKKTPANPDALAWNVAQGGRFDNVRWGEWPLKAVKIAIEAFNLTQLDFGGVDIMIDKDNNCYVLEINTAPSLTSPYRQECMAKAFDYIVEHNKARIPLIKEKGGYAKFIHPAICDKALV